MDFGENSNTVPESKSLCPLKIVDSRSNYSEQQGQCRGHPNPWLVCLNKEALEHNVRRRSGDCAR